MTADETLQAWQTWFGRCPPVRHLLRMTFGERWLRVHSLPNAKRLARTDAERKELVRRHNAVANAMLDEGAETAVILTYASGDMGEHEPVSVQRLKTTVVREWSRQWGRTAAYADELEDTVFALGEITWRSGAFDELIVDAAAGETAPILFVALRTGRIYSPYDGGADSFARDSAERDELRVRFAEWLSTRPDGL